MFSLTLTNESPPFSHLELIEPVQKLNSNSVVDNFEDEKQPMVTFKHPCIRWSCFCFTCGISDCVLWEVNRNFYVDKPNKSCCMTFFCCCLPKSTTPKSTLVGPKSKSTHPDLTPKRSSSLHLPPLQRMDQSKVLVCL